MPVFKVFRYAIHVEECIVHHARDEEDARFKAALLGDPDVYVKDCGALDEYNGVTYADELGRDAWRVEYVRRDD